MQRTTQKGRRSARPSDSRNRSIAFSKDVPGERKMMIRKSGNIIFASILADFVGVT